MSYISQKSNAYPPPPWKLQGQLYGSIWTLPARLMRFQLPPEFKAVVNFGRVGVFAGFVDYQPGGTLSYHELIAGLIIQQRGKLPYYFNVTHMGVDNEISLRGGRELWGVPKELAEFDYQSSPDNHDFRGIARSETGAVLAEGNFKATVTLPRFLKLPCPFPDLQMLHNQPHAASGLFWSRIEFCRGGMVIPPDSPLAELGIAGRKPWLSFGGLDFTMSLKAARPLTK